MVFTVTYINPEPIYVVTPSSLYRTSSQSTVPQRPQELSILWSYLNTAVVSSPEMYKKVMLVTTSRPLSVYKYMYSMPTSICIYIYDITTTIYIYIIRRTITERPMCYTNPVTCLSRNPQWGPVLRAVLGGAPCAGSCLAAASVMLASSGPKDHVSNSSKGE